MLLSKINIKIFVIIGVVFFGAPTQAVEYTLDNLDNIETWQINQDINEKRAEIQELTRQVEIYQKNISAKQREISSLSNQISTLDATIAKINLEIKTTELEIETVDLKIENTELKIEAKEREIAEQKEAIGQILRSLHLHQQENSILEILLLNDNFSDFLSEMDNLQVMQDRLASEVKNLKNIKEALADDYQSLETKKSELDTLKGILDTKIASLDGQKTVKYALMQTSQGQESQFRQMLDQAKQEQEQVNSDIVYLEKIAREKANRALAANGVEISDGLMWPIESRLITAYFHDPDYPYRYIFEHPAIDIATPQGTPIVAADSGYVAKAKDGGQTGYSYIMLIHADNMSTVYGHVNQISVKEDQYVSKGDVIGYSGGMPGTRGAGALSTGPHLHLEVRINGIPVDPLNYLP